MEAQSQWWGFVLDDGSIHIRPYLEPRQLIETRNSSGVHAVFSPFYAEHYFDARDKLLEKIRGRKHSA